MLIIADSGSTKTQWAIFDGRHWIFKETEGLNPYFVNEQKVCQVASLLIDRIDVSSVFFYGAGCAVEPKKNIIRRGLSEVFKKAETIVIDSDLMGAAISFYGDGKGWVGIIGTGSNIAFYNGEKLIKHKPSLGFILGDEGSGSHIGKKFLTKLLYKEFNNALMRKIQDYFADDFSDVLHKLYSTVFPNRYLASFVPFIYQNIDEAELRQLVVECFNEMIEIHLLPYYDKQYPLSFVGSVAFFFQNELQAALNHYEIKINQVVQSPIKGLVHYYQQKYL